jgi:hypothetical protein
MLSLICGDMRDRGEDVSAVRRGSLDTVAMVDTTLASFMINVEVLQVIVKVNTSSAEITAQECSMSREHGGQVDMSLPAERDREARLPFVEVGDDGLLKITRYVLIKSNADTDQFL